MVRGILRTQTSICDGTFLWIYSTAYYHCNTTSIIDVPLGYINDSQNIELFKVKVEQIFAIVRCKSIEMVKPEFPSI